MDAEVVIKTTKYDFLIDSGKASVNGIFSCELKPRDYYLKVSKYGYYFTGEEIILVTSQTDTIEVGLTVIEIICTSPMSPIYFQFGTSEFEVNTNTRNSDNREYILNMYADFLKENPGLIMEVQGHQDPSEKNFNLLSYHRAKKVADNLVERGVDWNSLRIGYYNWSVPAFSADLMAKVTTKELKEMASKLHQRVEFHFISLKE